MNEWITWDVIGTYAGAVAAVTALTQVIKQFIPQPDPKWIALGLSLVIMAFNLFFNNGEINTQNIIMALLNTLLITGASIGLYESAVKPVSRVIGKTASKV